VPPYSPVEKKRQGVFSDKVKGNGQSNQLPTILFIMDMSDKKKEQIKALIEKMKQEGKPIDWATAVLC
jgi:hypothetical protein